MKISYWNNPKDIMPEYLKALNQSGCIYEGNSYSGLLSPSSVIISRSQAEKIRRDIEEIFQWARTSQIIYEDLYKSRSSLVTSFEFGLNKMDIYFQRLSAQNQYIPTIGRIDAITLKQNVAEIQWKGGGEGFMTAIDLACKTMHPLSVNETSLADFITNWMMAFSNGTKKNNIYVLNTGRGNWQKGEKLLTDKLKEKGVFLFFSQTSDIEGKIIISNDNVYFRTENGMKKLDFIYLDRLSEVLSPEKLYQIFKCVAEGNVHIDPPLSYLWNQKITMALPFLEEFKDRFSMQIRDILIPTALIINGQELDLAPFIDKMNQNNAEILLKIKTLDQLLELPRNLREDLVVKCASANKYYCYGGHGVYRLWGSTKGQAQKIIDFIKERVAKGEPWIIQPYINQTWEIPFVHPDNLQEIYRLKAHARFGIYCSQNEQKSKLIGGIATFSPFWKVAGKTAGRDGKGQLIGSAFTDIRIEN